MRRYLFSLTLSLALPFLSCNPSSVGSDDGGTDGGTNCVNLQCRIVNCQAQGKPSTTLTGTVNIPAGNLPLYNATVYVPNSTVAPMTTGASCDRCTDVDSGSPVATTTTDAYGRFTLRDVPTGADIPLVIQLGKWRRQIKISNVPECTETPLAQTETRLPRNQSEGDIPKIALATGGFDAMECLLRKIGIDDAEFTPESGTGRINLFTGHGGTRAYCAQGTGSCTKTLNGGANFTVASDGGTPGWWSSLDNWKKYDTVLLSCEGGKYLAEKSGAARQALLDYINMGGRVFASHWHNVWLSQGPMPLPTIAMFADTVTPPLGYEYTSPITASIYTSTEKGNALADWMLNTSGSSNRGQVSIVNARDTVLSLDMNRTERFVYYNDAGRSKVAQQYFSFFAPIGAPTETQCGRMVFTDMHVSGNDAMSPNPNLDQSGMNFPFPSGCVTTALSPQEKALLFLIFDLTGCLKPVIG